jgi:cobalt/nickel transport system permease protein
LNGVFFAARPNPGRFPNFNNCHSPMHLPDHYLEPAIGSATAALAATAFAQGLFQSRSRPQPSAVSMATFAAGIFAAQMVNFPVSGGTSGHILGGALVAIVLGLWPAMLVMTMVLAVQTLLFADGGMGAFGANVLNMAVIAPLVGWGVFRFVTGGNDVGDGRRLFAAALAGWMSVMAAAVACSLELAVSGVHSFGETLAAMASIHAVIGLSEAFLTAAVVAFAVRHWNIQQVSASRWLGLAAAIGIVLVLAPLASSLPDGLESVAERLQFNDSGWAIAFPAPMPDYGLTGISNSNWATIIAGLAGVAACAATTWGIGRAVVPTHADSRS